MREQPFYLTTGATLKAKRLELKLTQKEVAQRAGVSDRTVRDLEMAQNHGVQLNVFIRILNALGLAINVFDDSENRIIEIEEDKLKEQKWNEIEEMFLKHYGMKSKDKGE